MVLMSTQSTHSSLMKDEKLFYLDCRILHEYLCVKQGPKLVAGEMSHGGRESNSHSSYEEIHCLSIHRRGMHAYLYIYVTYVSESM